MAKEAKFPGFSDRLRTALKRAGYWYSDRDEPHVLKFCVEKGHVSQYLYAYLSDNRTPDLERLKKLAHDLRVSMAWLLLGEDGVQEVLRQENGRSPKGSGGARSRRHVPIRGGSDAAMPDPQDEGSPGRGIMSCSMRGRRRPDPICRGRGSARLRALGRWLSA